MKNKSPKIDQSIVSIISTGTYDPEMECYVSYLGFSMDIIQINTKDLDHAPEYEIEYDIIQWTKLYKLCGDDIKIVGMNFPTNTERQQAYLRQKSKKNKNPVFQPFLEQRLRELEYIQKNFSSREYYLYVFQKSAEELKKTRERIVNILETGKTGKITILNYEEKAKVLHKMGNKNMMQ